MRDLHTILRRIEVGLPITEREYHAVLQRSEEVKQFRRLVWKFFCGVMFVLVIVAVSGHLYFWLK